MALLLFFFVLGLFVGDVRLVVGRLGVEDLLARDLLFYPDERGVEGGAEEDRQGGDVEVQEEDDDGAYRAVGLVVGVEVAAQIQVEGDAGQRPEQDADEPAGCDPPKRLVGVGGEVEDEGYRNDHEEQCRRPARYVPDEYELVSQGEYFG